MMIPSSISVNPRVSPISFAVHYLLLIINSCGIFCVESGISTRDPSHSRAHLPEDNRSSILLLHPAPSGQKHPHSGHNEKRIWVSLSLFQLPILNWYSFLFVFPQKQLLPSTAVFEPHSNCRVPTAGRYSRFYDMRPSTFDSPTSPFHNLPTIHYRTSQLSN